MLVTQQLVEQALQRPLTLSEHESLEFLSLEAEALISGHVGIDYDEPLAIVPMTVQVVAARMVARALATDPTQANVQSQTTNAGPYGQTQVFVAETRGGNAVYLSRMDKVMLRKVKPAFTTIRLSSGHRSVSYDD